MRWPNRKPHSLTAGMHRAQRAMSAFLPLIPWHSFGRRDATDRIVLSDVEGGVVEQKQVARFGVATDDQALLYLLRRDCLNADGRLDPHAVPLGVSLQLPMLASGRYRVTVWNTLEGIAIEDGFTDLDEMRQITLPDLCGEYAIAVIAA